MQSEAGAAGAVHGALQAGSLSTTFTASQGLLLMIPNMYKIAGELTPFTMHVAARTLATHALSIFGDHSDVMACRQTGFALLCSNSVQEAHDMAAVAHAATLESRIPFLHFFDGFRTSHEVAKIEQLTDDDLRALIAEPLIYAHRQRGLTPDRPVLRGTAQNPDVFFQAREAANRFYDACPEIVERTMERFGELTGRRYGLFEYVGPSRGRARDRADGLGRRDGARGRRSPGRVAARRSACSRSGSTGRSSSAAFLAALPKSVAQPRGARPDQGAGRARRPALPGRDDRARRGAGRRPPAVRGHAAGHRRALRPVVEGIHAGDGEGGLRRARQAEPQAALHDRHRRRRDAHVASLGRVVQDRRRRRRRRRCSTASAPTAPWARTRTRSRSSARRPTCYAQGYFVYDSKKSGAITVSHLRSSPRPIRSAYLVDRAGFVACHQFEFVDKIDVLEHAAPGAAFLLNAPFPTDEVWDHLPREMQEQIIEKKIRFFAIDAYELAKRAGMGGRINTIMQTCFFAISGVLPRDEAIAHIKKAIEKTYGKRGPEVVRRNCEVGGPGARAPARDPGAGGGDRHAFAAAAGLRARARLRAEGHRGDAGGQGRPAAGQRLPGRRHLAGGDREVGEAEHRARDPGLGSEDLHPVQPVRAGLPARGDPGEGLRRERARRRAADLQVDAVPGQRAQGQEVHDPGRAGGLHRLQPVRQRLPGQGPHQPEAQGDRHAPAGAAAGAGARQLRLLPRPARAGSHRR